MEPKRPLRVDLPKSKKIQFMVKCAENDTDMTTIVKKFISLYLSDNKELIALLSS